MNLTKIQSRALSGIIERFDARDLAERARRGTPINYTDVPPRLLNGNSRRTLNALLRAGLMELAPNNSGCWIVRVTSAGRIADAARKMGVSKR